MRTEQEVRDEMKWARYERFKKDPRYLRDFLDGYYHALRWVVGREKPLPRPEKTFELQAE